MANAKDKASSKIKRNLFVPTADLEEKFSEFELHRKKRIMFCVSRRLDDPILSDKEIINLLTTGGDGSFDAVSSSTAYRDLHLVNSVTGNIRLASKDWERYMIVETAKEEIKKWRGKDGKAVAALLREIRETRQLSKEDKPNLEESMVPPDYQITGDPEVIDVEGEIISSKGIDYNKRRKELREFYRSKAQDALINPKDEEELD